MSDDTPRYPCVHVDVRADDAERIADRLWDLGTTGVEERDATTLERASGEVMLVAHFDDEATARAAIDALGDDGLEARLEPIVGDDWKERWKEFFKPTRVGERLVVKPSWEPFEAREGDVVIVLDPGQAFGTGTHETTRLVLMEVEQRVAGGERVLDVGCGSGILGIGALKLGAARVVAVDVDPVAARVTEENAAANEVAIEASTTPIEDVTGAYELVLANIRSPILIPMAEALRARMAPGAVLVLSGLLVEEEAEVRAAFDAVLAYDGRRVEGDWLALTYRSAA